MDLISNMFSHIKNAIKINELVVNIPYSKINIKLLQIFYIEGFILGYKVNNIKNITVLLKYTSTGSTIKELKRISKPSKRIYIKSKQNYLVNNGLGFYILSTPQGLMTNIAAKFSNMGGEVICKIS